jgi:hypothetical protein
VRKAANSLAARAQSPSDAAPSAAAKRSSQARWSRVIASLMLVIFAPIQCLRRIFATVTRTCFDAR